MHHIQKVLLFTATATICLNAVAEQEPADSAKKEFENGVAALKNEDFPKALSAFEASYELRPKPVVLYNIGMCQKALFKYAEAVQTFRTLTAESDEGLSEARRKEALAALEELEKKVVYLKIVTKTEDAEIYLDGRLQDVVSEEAPLVINPGPHIIESRKNGHTGFRKEFTVNMGEKKTLELPELVKTVDTVAAPETVDNDVSTAPSTDTEPRKHRPATKRDESPSTGARSSFLLLTGSIAALSVGAGGLVIGAVFTYQWNQDYDALSEGDAACKESWRDNCLSRHDFYDDKTKRDEALLISGFAIGGVFATAGAVLMVLDRRMRKKAAVSFIPSPSGLSITF